MTTRSRLLVGTVRHRRHRPRPNVFRYVTWHLLLDVDDLDGAAAGVVGLHVGGRGVVVVRRTDHFGSADLPLRDKVGRWVAGQGGRLPDGPLLAVAHPRVFGHVFNPVSWWFAFEPDGTLGLVVAEVRNTFGDWRAYLLDDLVVTGRTVTATTDKSFHVSPFLPVDGLTYHFRIRPPTPEACAGEAVAVHLDVVDADGVVLDATQSQRVRPLTTRTLWTAMLRHPLVTVRTVALIHLQAARLWWRRTPLHRRPAPPPTGLDAVVEPAREGADSEPAMPDHDAEEASA